MDFTLTEEQIAISDMAGQFARERMSPYAREWDEGCIFPVDILREGASLGFGGLYVRSDVGGAELGRLDAVLVFEQLARGCTSTAAYISIHNMCCWMIDHYGSEAQRQKFLPKLCSMEHFAGYCLTEPGAGSDAASLKTRAEREGDSYILNGTKAFISGGGVADIYVVMARSGGEGASGISCFLVERDMPGLSFGAQEVKLGWKSQPTAMVQFDNVRVGKENRIGDEGMGFKIAMAGLDGGRLNIAACSLGAGRESLNRAVEYMKERRQFGKALAEFQALQFRMADCETELEAARLLLLQAAMAVDSKSPQATKLAAMAKRFATDTGFRVVNEALQFHGGYGYLRDFPIERFLRDVRVHQILEGTNEVMRLIIARDIFGA